MKKSDFFYHLPDERIAQFPLEPRDSSRVLVYSRKEEKLNEIIFKDIDGYFKEGDVLVLNNSKVLPARIYGEKSTGANVEFLLLKEVEKETWETLAKPGKKAKIGEKFVFSDKLSAVVINVLESGNRVLKFTLDDYTEFYNILDKIGEMPLPHYITETLKDKNRYQTIYANPLGSSAAPTAGLHFTDEVFLKLKKKGVIVAFVTLHVGLGTFRPVKSDDILDHKMHSEWYTVSEETAKIINQAKKENRRIISVGTTSLRTLESAVISKGVVEAKSDDTSIFITPGYDFKIVNGLLTNFHLPESTLIMLVSAFMGYEKTMELYKYAVENKYRFYSLGDAMLIL